MQSYNPARDQDFSGEDISEEENPREMLCVGHETVSQPSGHIRWPLGFATVISLGLLAVGVLSLRPSNVQSPPQAAALAVQEEEFQPAELQPRLLESPQLLDMVVDQGIAFTHGQGRVTPTPAERAELTKLARHQVQAIDGHVRQHNPEAARQLRETRLEPEHWEHTSRLLSAMHDERVLSVGRDIQAAVNASAGNETLARRLISERLSSRSEELGSLRNELIPAPLRDVPLSKDGRAFWEAAAMPVLDESGDLFGFHTQLTVASIEGSGGRRLSAMGVTQQVILWVVTAVLSVITTVMTAIYSFFPLFPIALLFWALQGIVSLGLCGLSALGGHFVDYMGSPSTWFIPCEVGAGMFGLEAIWTWIGALHTMNAYSGGHR